jgi:hypothetical protein
MVWNGPLKVNWITGVPEQASSIINHAPLGKVTAHPGSGIFI